MSDYNLIAFDMDGTLLDSDKKIRDDSLDAMSTAASHGKIIALSTGRCMPELVEPLKELKNVRYVIAVSGALVMDVFSNTIIHSSPIDADIISEIFKRIDSCDVMVHMHSDKSIIQQDMLDKMSDYHMDIYHDMFEKITFRPENLPDYFNAEHPPVYKFNIYSKNVSERKVYEELLRDLPITMAYSEETSLEISSLGTTKGTGLAALCNHIGIPVGSTIAVGDADNDLEILKTAGLAVAMGNANENVKAVADVIVADNNNGGCAEAIHRYLL